MDCCGGRRGRRSRKRVCCTDREANHGNAGAHSPDGSEGEYGRRRRLMTVTSLARSKLSAPWRHIDAVMVGSAVLLMIAGAMMIYSAKPSYLGRQLIWIALGCAALLGVSTTDYRRFKGYAPVLYWGLVALLVVLLVVGAATRGSRAWFNFGYFALQPSEFGKPIFILFLASIMNDVAGVSRDQIKRMALRERYSFADLPEELTNAALEKLKDATLDDGKKMFVTRAVTLSTTVQEQGGDELEGEEGFGHAANGNGGESENFDDEGESEYR
ncbi:MAG: hypothetical protein DCC49_11010 [Acidobacteria bacterium]|nr:MAG: hypothetical protein DCC49_11010 [Acidobacteriota bacterium]